MKDARKLATAWNAKFLAGIDPAAEQRAEAEQRQVRKQSEIKFQAVADDYLRRKVIGKDAYQTQDEAS